MTELYETKIANILKNIITIMITNDLTIGRTDDDKEPLSQEEISIFINNNEEKINKVISNIIYDYKDTNELELLENPLYDWIGEYLYETINT
jgi:purine nucleoside phosphorylase